MRRGPKAPINPEVLLVFLDARSDYEHSGHPVRLRKTINGIPVKESDARMIRRWRVGKIKGVTRSTVRALLRRYHIDQKEFHA